MEGQTGFQPQEPLDKAAYSSGFEPVSSGFQEDKTIGQTGFQDTSSSTIQSGFNPDKYIIKASAINRLCALVKEGNLQEAQALVKDWEFDPSVMRPYNDLGQ